MSKQTTERPTCSGGGYADRDIPSLYSSVVHRCAKCEKQESSKKFPVCSRCKKVYYCSRECQAGHWKTHKKLCNDKKGIKKPLTVAEQVVDFKNQFKPLLMTMALWTMERYYGNDCGRSAWRGNTHLLIVELVKTPPGSPAGFKIGGREVCAIQDREDFIQASIREEKANLMAECGPNDSYGFLLLAWEDGPHTKSELMSFMFEGTFDIESVNKEIVRFPESHQFMMFDIQAADMAKQINAMATGEAKAAMDAAEVARTR